MKIKGQVLKAANEEVIVLPRGDSQIVLKAKAVLDMDQFKKLCPEPKPPVKLLPSGVEVPNVKDESYLKKLDEHGQKRIDWLIITSLSATEDLTWDQINPLDADTWHLYDKELRETGFSEFEVMHIVSTVLDVNSLNEKKLKEARERFLASQSAVPEE